MKNKDIYHLKLHETCQLKSGIIVMRVPGGWIYDAWDTEKDCFKSGLFIPKDDDCRKDSWLDCDDSC